MLIQAIFFMMATYLLLGFLFAIAFVIKGAAAIDEGARGGSTGFKLIIIPGAILLWPLLLKKWLTSNSSQHDQAT